MLEDGVPCKEELLVHLDLRRGFVHLEKVK